MPHVIVMHTRGRRHRLAEWLDYHAGLGFEEFHFLLDGDVDGSADLLASLDGPVRVVVHPYPEEDEYYDGLSAQERWDRIRSWRERHAKELARSPYGAMDPQALRQARRLVETLPRIVEGRRGWLAHFDDDEFLNIPGGGGITSLTDDPQAPRLRFLNFNVDTRDLDPHRPVLEQQGARWSREALLAHPQQVWAARVKTIARFRAVLPFTNVHQLSAGRHRTVDPDLARIHHFRVPAHDLVPPIGYDVVDPIVMTRG